MKLLVLFFQALDSYYCTQISYKHLASTGNKHTIDGMRWKEDIQKLAVAGKWMLQSHIVAIQCVSMFLK